MIKKLGKEVSATALTDGPRLSGSHPCNAARGKRGSRKIDKREKTGPEADTANSGSWRRMNGWGYASGVFSGLLLSLMVLAWPKTPQYVYSPIIHGAALAGCIVGSLLTRPVDKETLLEFYRRVRPKGFWKPVRSDTRISAEDRDKGLDRTLLIIVNVLLGMAAIFCADLLPFYFIGHWFRECLVCFIVLATACAVLYFTWYRPLKAKERE